MKALQEVWPVLEHTGGARLPVPPAAIEATAAAVPGEWHVGVVNCGLLASGVVQFAITVTPFLCVFQCALYFPVFDS